MALERSFVAAPKPEAKHSQRASSAHVEDADYYGKRASAIAVAKTKSGDYAGAMFSVVDRSTPLLPRLLDLAHVIVHHSASQVLDCMLSLYLALLMILKVPREHKFVFDDNTDYGTLFLCSYSVCFVVFLSEMVLEVFARYSRRAEDRSLHRGKVPGFVNYSLDIIVCGSLIAEIVFYVSNFQNAFNFVGLRIFKVFKYLRVWAHFSDLNDILEAVSHSMKMMANIMFALAVTLILYCIIAVQIFGDTFYRLCQKINVGTPLVPVQYCATSAQCPNGFECVSSKDNLPKMGINAFDNSYKAFVQLIQVVLPDNWPPSIMNPVAQSNPDMTAVVRFYFYTLVVFDALVLLNLCIAVMSFAFQRIRDATKVLEPEVRLEDPKLQSIKNIALQINPSIFAKHVKRSISAKLSSNIVVPEESVAISSDADIINDIQTSSFPTAPDESGQLSGFRRKAKPHGSPMRSATNVQSGESITLWARFHYLCLHLVSLPAFEYFILFVVCLNCIQLAMNYQGMPSSYTSILEYVDFAFTAIFLFEMLLKIISFGVVKYLKGNLFDFVVIAFSVVDILMTYAFTAANLPNLTILRMFRVLRIFRALKRMKKLMQVLGMVFKSGAALGNLLIFTVVFFIAMGVLGKEFFGGREMLSRADASDQFDRMNFDTTANAIELLYRVTTGEVWSNAMHKFMLVKYDSIFSDDDSKYVSSSSSVLALIFFVGFYLFSNFIVINVLVSVILENFDVSDVDRAEEFMNMLSTEDEDVREHQKGSFSDAKASIFGWISAKRAQEQFYIKMIAHRRSSVSSALSHLTGHKATSNWLNKNLAIEKVTRKVSTTVSDRRASVSVSQERANSNLPGKKVSIAESTSLHEQLEGGSPNKNLHLMLTGSHWHPGFLDHIRILSYAVLNSRWYPFVLYGTIFLSSLTLAFTPPRHETTPLDQPPLVYINIVFWFVFFMEFFFSVCLSPISYFVSGWNLLDFVILVLTSIDLLGTLSVIPLRLGFFRVIRLVRSLRPLRMLNKNENIRNVINTVIGSLPSVAYVVLLYLVVCLIFAVIALQLFMGKMNFCNDPSMTGYLDCIGIMKASSDDSSDAPDILMPRAWLQYTSNFDDAIQGMIALFRVTTLQWTGIYFSICDITDFDTNRSQDANKSYGLFILLFILISGFCIINMFVAVIVEYFKTSSGSRLLTPHQKSWVQTRRFISALKFETPAPKNKMRNKLFRIVHSSYFELCISCVIGANGLIMLLQSRDQSADFDNATNLVNDIALYIFIVEMIVKILALGPLGYCRDNWNLFDGSLIIFSIVMNQIGSDLDFAGQLLRLLRLFRLVRLIRRATSFKTLWDAFVISLPAIANICLLIFLIFWIYAVIGVSQFGDTRPGKYWVGSGFDSFPRVFMTLGNLVGGENWDSLYDDVSVEYPYCTLDTVGPDGDILVYGDCGGFGIATAYFFVFIVMVRFMLMNLFLAVVVENFSICFEPIEGLIEHVHVDHFLKVFACFCHKDHKFSTLREYLNYINMQNENERENVYGDPEAVLHRSLVHKFLMALRVHPDTGEQPGMAGYSNPLAGHLLGYHGRRHYLCVRAEIDDFIKERTLREAKFSERLRASIVEKWRVWKKKVSIWWMKLTKQRQTNAAQASHTLVERKAFVLRRFRRAAVMANRQNKGQNFASQKKPGWEAMVEALRQRERERLQNSLSREELFSILVTWSVPISHLTEVERRKRISIIDNFHRQSAQQLIHAMFVGRKVRAARKAATKSSKKKFFGAAKFVGRTHPPASNTPAANVETQQDEHFEEVQSVRRVSSKVVDKRTLAEEQDAFVRACLKTKSQLVSSKKLLQKIQHDCTAAQIRLTEQACPPEDSQNASPITSARDISPNTKHGNLVLYSSPALPGSPLK